MRLHKKFVISVLGAAISWAGYAQADAAQPIPKPENLVATIEGFAQPESVEADVSRNYLYVSNIAGHPLEEDGIGYISRVRPDGSGLEVKWVEGLHAPKGLALEGNRLYVADLKELVVIDVDKGKVIARYPVAEAKMLNGIAVSPEGQVYVSDFFGNTLYQLKEGELTPWIQNVQLDTPNGLSISGDQLTVVTWGADIQEDFSTKSPGHILQISLKNGKLGTLANTPRGNWDGVVDVGGHWLVSNWLSGEVVSVGTNGETQQVLQLNPGSADLGWNSESGVLWVPEMQLGRVTGYKVDPSTLAGPKVTKN